MMATQLSYPAQSATVDDMMEVSTDTTRQTQIEEDIDIDLEAVDDSMAHIEDEHMGEGSVSYKGDEEMVDDTHLHEDEIIEDVLDYDPKAEELRDADDAASDTDEPEQADDTPVRAGIRPVASTSPVDDPEPDDNDDTGDLEEELDDIVDEISYQENDFVKGGEELGTDGLEVEQDPDTLAVEDVTSGPSGLESFGDDPAGATVQVSHEGVDHEDDEDPTSTAQHTTHEVVEQGGEVQESLVSHHDEVIEEDEQESPFGSTEQPGEGTTEKTTSRHADPHSNEAREHDEDSDEEYQAIVSYQESEMFLFPPLHGDEDESQTYLLNDESLAKTTIRTLLDSCHGVLGESINKGEELELNIPILDLCYAPSIDDSSSITLADLIDLYSRLQQNDGVEGPEPLKLLLSTRRKLSHRFSALYEAAEQGRGLSHVSKSQDSSRYISEQSDSPSEAQSEAEEGEQEEHDHEAVEADDASAEPESRETEPQEFDSNPGTPRGDWLKSHEGMDEIDFNSPQRAFKGDAGAGLTDNNEETLAVSTDPNQDSHTGTGNVFGDDNPANYGDDHGSYGDLFDQDQSHEAGLDAGTELPLGTNGLSDDHLVGDFDFTAASANDGLSVLESAHVDATIPPEHEDDLGQSLEDSNQHGETGLPSSTTITNDGMSSKTLQADEFEADLQPNAAEDEITYGDDLVDFGELEPTTDVDEAPGLQDAQSPSAGSLKRQLSAVGDEDTFDPSMPSQPDAKRLRGEDEA